MVPPAAADPRGPTSAALHRTTQRRNHTPRSVGRRAVPNPGVENASDARLCGRNRAAHAAFPTWLRTGGAGPGVTCSRRRGAATNRRRWGTRRPGPGGRIVAEPRRQWNNAQLMHGQYIRARREALGLTQSGPRAGGAADACNDQPPGGAASGVATAGAARPRRGAPRAASGAAGTRGLHGRGPVLA